MLLEACLLIILSEEDAEICSQEADKQTVLSALALTLWLLMKKLLPRLVSTGQWQKGFKRLLVPQKNAAFAILPVEK